MSIHNPARTLVLFPGALGDFCCLLPTLVALNRPPEASLTVCARSSWLVLSPPDMAKIDFERAEVADLFGSEPLRPETRRLFRGFERALSWTGSGVCGFRRRLEQATGGAALVFPFRGMAAGEHAAAYYARCASVPLRVPRLIPGQNARQWARAWETSLEPKRPLLALHPGSGSPSKNWEGMCELAQWWMFATGGTAVILLGPAEVERGWRRPDGSPAVVAQPLDRLAALLERADVYVGNDSGVTHLAGLVGTPGVALFGPTDPEVWGPLGGRIRVLAAPSACAKGCKVAGICTHRLPVEQVGEVLLQVLHRGP